MKSNNKQNQEKLQNLEEIDPLLLQSYFDEELPEDESQVLMQRFASMEEERLRLEALGELHRLVHFEHQEQVEEVDFSQLWSRIEEELPQVRKVAPEASKVGLWERFQEFIERQRFIMLPGLGAVAIATLVLIPVLMNSSPEQGSDVQISITPRALELASGVPSSDSVSLAVADAKVSEPKILVIVTPLSGNQVVSYTFPGTPVIWYTGGETGEAVEAVNPQDLPEIWPRVEALLKDLNKRSPGVFAPLKSSPGENNGPI